jgi:dihydrolipoamide dehydrogenase
MADFDVLVIGGGPGGYAAALRAAERGAGVALIEAERPGGACVHHACIPTNALLGAVETFLPAQELSTLGVLKVDEQFSLGRAGARAANLARIVASGVEAALKSRKVQVVRGRAAFAGPGRVTVTGDAAGDLSAEAIVIATGARWEPPLLPGVAPERVLTADQVQALQSAPASALVLGGGQADALFALEYAFLLAVAGTRVTIATPYERLLPALDASLADVAAAVLTDAGIAVLTRAEAAGGSAGSVRVRHAGGEEDVPAEVVIAADPRRPLLEPLNLAAAGVRADGFIGVDRACRTNFPTIFAAGDVTGGAMLTNAALHMGEVAGTNATGGEAVTRLRQLPQLLHTEPQIGWIGLSEQQARDEGYDVRVGLADLGFNARAVTLGARQGAVKLVAERELGEILGVHIVGPGAAEILAAAAVAMQAECPLDELATTVFWHPSLAEALVEAARRAL